MYGDAINLSARLMMKASEGMADILCDDNTHELAPHTALFTKLDPIKVASPLQPSYYSKPLPVKMIVKEDCQGAIGLILQLQA